MRKTLLWPTNYCWYIVVIRVKNIVYPLESRRERQRKVYYLTIMIDPLFSKLHVHRYIHLRHMLKLGRRTLIPRPEHATNSSWLKLSAYSRSLSMMPTVSSVKDN